MGIAAAGSQQQHACRIIGPNGPVEALSHLAEGAAAPETSLSQRALLRLSARATAQICDVDRCSIFLWRRNHLFPAMTELASGEDASDVRHAFNALGPCDLEKAPAVARALREGQAVLVSNPWEGSVPHKWVKALDLRSLLVVPLLHGHRVVGALLLDNWRKQEPMTLEHAARARPLASLLALAVENARLSRTTRDRLHETRALLGVAPIAGSTLDLQELARRITWEAARAVRADSAGIYLTQEGTLQPLAGYHVPKAFLDSLSQQSIPLGQVNEPPAAPETAASASIWSDDVPNDPALSHEILRRFPVQSVVVTRLRAGDERLGVLVCAWWTRRRRLKRAELRLLEGIAAQAAVAIVNARDYDRAGDAAVGRERSRLDSVLHDTLNRTLFSMALRLGLCFQSLRGRSEIRTHMQALKQDVTLMMAQIRSILSPEPNAEPPGPFAERVEQLLHNLGTRTGMKVQFVQQGRPADLDQRDQDILFQAVAAVLNSAARRRPRSIMLQVDVSVDEAQYELLGDWVTDPAVAIERLVEPPAALGSAPKLESFWAAGGRMECWERLPGGFRLRGNLPLRGARP